MGHDTDVSIALVPASLEAAVRLRARSTRCISGRLRTQFSPATSTFPRPMWSGRSLGILLFSFFKANISTVRRDRLGLTEGRKMKGWHNLQLQLHGTFAQKRLLYGPVCERIFQSDGLHLLLQVTPKKISWPREKNCRCFMCPTLPNGRNLRNRRKRYKNTAP